MKKRLIFKTVVFDTEIFSPGPIASSHDFFRDTPDNEESATVHPEQRIVSWLFHDQPIARNLILGELGIGEDCLFKLEVTEPVIKNINTKPGDVDILIYPKNQPNKAIAIECKRVKVVVKPEGSEKINKIQSIGDAVIQGNALRSMGFHNTYICILIVTDGRERTENNVLFRGPTNSTFHEIYDFPQKDRLDPKVGVMFIEIVQPTGKNIEKMAAVKVCVDKPAKPQMQPAEFTNRIIHALSSKN